MRKRTKPNRSSVTEPAGRRRVDWLGIGVGVGRCGPARARLGLGVAWTSARALQTAAAAGRGKRRAASIGRGSERQARPVKAKLYGTAAFFPGECCRHCGKSSKRKSSRHPLKFPLSPPRHPQFTHLTIRCVTLRCVATCKLAPEEEYVVSFVNVLLGLI